MTSSRRRRSATILLLAAALLPACGNDGAATAPDGVSQTAFERQLRDAQNVTAADFPAPAGKTLQQLADATQPGPQAALASSVFEPGANRLAFGVLEGANRSVYGKTAVYVGRVPMPAPRGRSPRPPTR